MTEQQLTVESVEQLTELAAREGTALTLAALFMLIVLVAVIFVLIESRNDRKDDRAERKADREERQSLNATRIKREDDNNSFLQTAIEKMTAAVTSSNELGNRLEETLRRTHDVHDDLDGKVIKIANDIASLRQEIAQRDASRGQETERILKALERMESALAKIPEERRDTHGS